MGLPAWLSGKEPVCQCRRCQFDPWVGTIPWVRKWQPTPVFLPVEFHGQRSLVGYSPWGRKELDTTEQLSTAHRNRLIRENHKFICMHLHMWISRGEKLGRVVRTLVYISIHNYSVNSVSRPLMSNSLRPHGLYPARLLCHGILQARILEWVVIPFSRGSSWPRDQTWVSWIAGRFFTIWATREARLKQKKRHFGFWQGRFLEGDQENMGIQDCLARFVTQV